MYCPKCASQNNDDVKFCRQCGANLRFVQEVIARGGEKEFSWQKTWVAEMLMSEQERDRLQGVTPEIKRLNELKGGVITALVGLGSMIFLKVLLAAVAAGEPEHDARILHSVWVVGIVPFLVGLGLIFNGLFVSKKIVRLKEQLPSNQLPTPNTAQLPPQMPSARPGSSVTDPTTALLDKMPPVPVSSEREKD